MTENEAVIVISWKNDILEGQEECADIQSDVNKIWDEDVLMGSFYKSESDSMSLYYYVHGLHKTYSSLTMSYMATFSRVSQQTDFLIPCCDLNHGYQLEAYLPYH